MCNIYAGLTADQIGSPMAVDLRHRQRVTKMQNGYSEMLDYRTVRK
jgi:hypothetical protein